MKFASKIGFNLLILLVTIRFSQEDVGGEFETNNEFPVGFSNRPKVYSIIDSMDECISWKLPYDQIETLTNVGTELERLFWRSPIFCKIKSPVLNAFCMMVDIFGRSSSGQEFPIQAQYRLHFCYWDFSEEESIIRSCYNVSEEYKLVTNAVGWKCFHFANTPILKFHGIYSMDLDLINVDEVRKVIKNNLIIDTSIKLYITRAHTHPILSLWTYIFVRMFPTTIILSFWIMLFLRVRQRIKLGWGKYLTDKILEGQLLKSPLISLVAKKNSPKILGSQGP